MDDFLWECALNVDNESRFDIIPNYEDDMSHFGRQGAPTNRTFHLSHRNDALRSLGDRIEVPIIESRDNGVLDIIGGELWEGALLLCALILSQPQLFLTSSVLELGSGVGLPALLLAALKVVSSSTGSIILSDNDPRVVDNLNEAIQLQFPSAQPVDGPAPEAPYNTRLETTILDWSVFMNQHDGSAAQVTTSTSVNPAAEQVLAETLDSEVIMGCELCYAPYHARCLAELLRAYLSSGACQRVVIVQMRDREGFAELLRNLKAFGLSYSITEIPDHLYGLAQRIGCISGAHAGNSAQKTFVFDGELLQDSAISIEGTSSSQDSIGDGGGDGAQSAVGSVYASERGTGGGGRLVRELLRTEKEHFVILSIGCTITL